MKIKIHEQQQLNIYQRKKTEQTEDDLFVKYNARLENFQILVAQNIHLTAITL